MKNQASLCLRFKRTQIFRIYTKETGGLGCMRFKRTQISRIARIALWAWLLVIKTNTNRANDTNMILGLAAGGLNEHEICRRLTDKREVIFRVYTNREVLE